MFSSCKNKDSKESNWIIELPETKNPTNLYQWAIVKYELSRLRDEPEEDSKIVNYLPEGVIISNIVPPGVNTKVYFPYTDEKNRLDEVKDELTKFNNKNGHWFYIDYEGEKGWIFESFIEIFNSYDEALKRSEEIILGNKIKN